MTADQIKDDLERYLSTVVSGDWATGLAIERRYGLDGYPPDVVTQVLSAGANGEDMVAAEDRAIGFTGGDE